MRFDAGINCVDPTQSPLDLHGHGTAVAGIIAASDNDVGTVGVAPNALLYPVKVATGSVKSIEQQGRWLLCGLNWLKANAATTARTSSSSRPGVTPVCGALATSTLSSSVSDAQRGARSTRARDGSVAIQLLPA